MSETIPLFPLGTVLYPGLLLPLHIFEDRYRQLVGDLLEGPEPRRFGVIAIRKGRETGIDGVSALYEVGCAAVLRRVERYEDGRYDIITAGAERFRLLGLDESRPYLQAEVEWLPEETGDEAAAGLAARATAAAFRGYLEALTRRGLAEISVPDLPSDPGTAVLPGGRGGGGGPAGPPGAAGPAGRAEPPGVRAGAAGPGDRHDRLADRAPRPGPALLPVQFELRREAVP